MTIYRFFFLLLGLCGTVAVAAQDLFDYAHTRQYAQFLLRGGQYKQAGLEYQRLVFLKPENDTFKVQLLRAYRLGGEYQFANNQWQRWAEEQALLPSNVYFEYAKLLLQSGHAQDALVLSAMPRAMDSLQTKQVRLFSSLLLQDWAQAEAAYAVWPGTGPTTIPALLERARATHYKKPWVAATLSAIVPGAGKVYTKDWTDGAIAFVFVGMNAWQSWRRFDREGVRSVWGWFHGGFAAGFYIGNIYGGHKAARMYNQRQKHKLQHEAERIVFPYF